MSKMKCSHCGQEFEVRDSRKSHFAPTHDFPRPARAVCPGAGKLLLKLSDDSMLGKDKPAQMDNGPGVLQIGTNNSKEVIVNLPQDMTGFLKFSAHQARFLATVLLKKADDVDPPPHGDLSKLVRLYVMESGNPSPDAMLRAEYRARLAHLVGMEDPRVSLKRWGEGTKHARFKEMATRKLADGESCGHRGCLQHFTDACEGCGRRAGKGTAEVVDTKEQAK